MQSPEDRKNFVAATSLWWLGILTGIVFLVLGFVVLSYDAGSLLAVSVLIGISFLFTGLTWLIAGVTQHEMRWWFLVGGALALIAGIIAFAYPDETLVVLGLLLGWFLLVAGIIDIVGALANRDAELWWLGLVQGLLMLVLGVWAAGEDGRSVFLVLTLTGIYCVLRGVGEILTAFLVHKVREEAQVA
jgi:uncharacterized membrane protein HdeD (DUF308 family)